MFALILAMAVGWQDQVQNSEQAPQVLQKQVQKEWEASPVQKSLHDIHVRERSRRGLFRQALDRRLCSMAQSWAEVMASQRSMYHSNYGVQENVAVGYGTPESAMSVWIGSSGHYANLMSGADAVGFGAAQDSGGTWYWCSMHGGGSSDGTAAAVEQCEAGSCAVSSGGEFAMWIPGRRVARRIVEWRPFSRFGSCGLLRGCR